MFSISVWATILLLAGTVPGSTDWDTQASHDARQDVTRVVFDGKSPDRLACDTTLRAMPDGSWVIVMLGGGDREPLPANGIWISRSADCGKTWTPMTAVDLGVKRRDPNCAIVPSELMVHGGRCTLFLSTHDGKFGDWKSWYTHSDDSCRSFGALIPAPGELHKSTFLRNHIVTRDGRLMVPYQHYLGERGPRNPRNGVIVSADGGRTWTSHGAIRIAAQDDYSGWAENNIVELADGRIAMILRADRLGGVLFQAESCDGGRTWPEFAVKSQIPNPGSKATLYPLGGNAVALLHNPNAAHRSPLALWVSFDGLKTWPYRRVLVPQSCDGPKGWLNYPDGFVSGDRQFLHFAFDDNRHRAVYFGAKLPPLSAAEDGVKQFRSMTDCETRAVQVDVLRKVADLALVPPRINTRPLPAFDYDRLDYGMTPSITRTPKGRLWSIWFAGEDGPRAFLLANSSDDDGATWSKPRVVINAQDTRHLPLPRSIVMGNVWCDPDGRLRLFFSQSMMHFDGRASTWESVCDNPDSDAPAWSKPRWIWHGGVHNKPIVLAGGEWLLPLDLERDGYGFFQGVFKDLDPLRGLQAFASNDHGASWQRRGCAVPRGVSHYAEHMFLERKDGSLWMLMRTNQGLMESISKDRGATWSEPCPTTTIRHPVSRFFFCRLASGRILLVKHGDTVDSFGGKGQGFGQDRNRLKAFLSEDDGVTWKGGLMLDERSGVSYPDGFQSPDGTIYVAYDRNRPTDGEILLARFTEPDVLAGRLTGPKSKLRILVCRPLKNNH
jgi:predicted neuraminidase